MNKTDEPADASLATRVVNLLREHASRTSFLSSLVPELVTTFGGRSGGIVLQQHANWVVEHWSGPTVPLPEELIGHANDEGRLRIDGGWCVVPLETRPQSIAGDSGSANFFWTPTPTAFVLRLSTERQGLLQASLDESTRMQAAVDVLASALQRIDSEQRLALRVSQLSDVLEAAAEWQRLDDDEALLRAIADMATQLLHCERASIFLWDRRRRKLIGRPALGVKGEALEVDDDAGVVGEVLRTAQPKIWNAKTDDEKRINRQVDRALDFETHSLVAVPMDSHRGEIIGVFEAINHRGAATENAPALRAQVAGFDDWDALVLADLASHAAVAIESQRKRRTLTESRDRLVDDAASATPLVGHHPSMVAVRNSANKVAPTDLTVMVLGKNGTGKEVLARHIHYESRRRNGPFVAVNCAALVETLLESELFGHEKGAFTDANQTRAGKFELANGGTLFLDEVGDMSPGGQSKLLRVLEEKVVVRVGGSQPIPVDVRVIAATNQPLEQLIAEKRFREDLFFRLNVVSLTLPPLAARGDDVLCLAEHFLATFCYQIGRQVPTLHPDTRQKLLSHPWPGNIRELRNTIERVCYLCNETVIMENDLMLSGASASGNHQSGSARAPETNHSQRPSSDISRIDAGSLEVDPLVPLSEATRQFQVAHIEQAIAACNGNMTDAAARLGLHRSNLYRKMRQLGMPTSGE